ncbi:GNAT family N-acetyltransferase [Paenibacillus puerhi]|uniref:GNAT family N-acetyltransferase n=1 Tax=Paenibacillus puerhi TaxID=2692622 RepID=UPI0013586D1E|nr:GNAT family N-acetyltransferase [Paenibacillus puerhi]
MQIRPLEKDHRHQVMNVMAEHPLQFPEFIIRKYPARWDAYLSNEEEDNQNCGYFVMLDENEHIIGHAGYLFNDEVNLYEIVGVVVKKDQKRRGIGKALIKAVCKKISECGGDKVILYTLGHVDNQDTLIFYNSIGFEQISDEKDYYFPGFHRVTFIKVRHGC